MYLVNAANFLLLVRYVRKNCVSVGEDADSCAD